MAKPTRERHKGVYVHGEEMKRNLIDTAIDLFGRWGFDAVGTRRIAEDAGASISTISYYFGNKQGLLIAAAEYISGGLRARLAPVLARLRQSLDDPDLTRDEALDAFLTMLDVLADIVIPESEETQRWARFITREQMEAGPALGALDLRELDTLGAMLVARVRGSAPDDVDNAIRTQALFGQVLIFRTARASSLAAMGKTRLSETDAGHIKAVIREHAIAVLTPAEAPADN